MPRYVILYHQRISGDEDLTHWDLMLETNNVLRTWKITAAPQPGLAHEAIPLPDHRIAYLDYEGPISGNRGKVHQLDSGTFSGTVPRSDETFSLQINGHMFQGTLTLEPSPGSPSRWFVQFPARNNGDGINREYPAN